MKRRDFIKTGCVTGAAALLSTRSGLSFSGPASPVLVFVRLVGGADTLALLPAIEDRYYALFRPTLAISAKKVAQLKLSSPFALHPNAAELLPLWKDRSLAFLVQVGLPGVNRSHFIADDQLQLGQPTALSHDRVGFLLRALRQLKLDQPIRAVAMEPAPPLCLRGGLSGVIGVTSLEDLKLQASSDLGTSVFKMLYEGDGTNPFANAGREILGVQKELETLLAKRASSDFNKNLPQHEFGQSMAEIGWLIANRPEIPVFVSKLGNWDSHASQGSEEGRVALLIKKLSDGIATLRARAGSHWERTIVIAMSEFGRCVGENVSGGTDHGYGGITLVAGGKVRGGRIYGPWKELKKENLFEERDLPVATDYRQVFAEVLDKHLAMPNIEGVFPGFKYDRNRNLGFLS